MKHPESMTEALNANMCVQCDFDGYSGDSNAWARWQAAFLSEATTLQMEDQPSMDVLLEKLGVLNSSVDEISGGGSSAEYIAAVEDGCLYWDTEQTTIYVLSAANVAEALADAPEYEYEEPEE